jgi:autotransporter strand-loop-strand O-heptosyltransferase
MESKKTGFNHIVAHTSFLGRTGYNIHSRGFFTALNKLIPVRVRNYSSSEENPYFYLSEEQRRMLIKSTINPGNITIGAPYDTENLATSKILNIVLNETNHYYFYDNYEGRKIAYNVWESTRQPEEFFKKLLEYDQLWVPTQWQKDVTVEQGYPEDRIHIIHEAVDPEFVPSDEVASSDVFKFLVFGRWDYRKSIPELVSAFIDVYGNNEDYELILDTDNPFATDGMRTTEERLEHYGYSNYKNIKVLHYPNREEYVKILQRGHVFLSCARSEGWNIPLMNAMACGIPVIYSNYGAQLEFTIGKGRPVRVSEMLPASDVFNVPNCPGEYCEPDYVDLRQAMLDVVKNYDEYLREAKWYSEILRADFTWENAAQSAYEALEEMEYPELDKLKGRPGDPDYTYGEIFKDRVYEFKDCMVKPGDVVVDLGANIGMFSIYAAKHGAKHVYAFEPVKETYEYLCDNIESQGLTNVSTYRRAVTGTDEVEVPMHVGMSTVGAHVLNVYQDSDVSEYVPNTSLNYILRTIPYIDFLKIDIEGSEYQIFDLVDFELLSKKVSKIAIELHGDHWLDNSEEFFNRMKTLGFVAYYYSPLNTANDVKSQPDSTYGAQYLYLVKDSPVVTTVLEKDGTPKVLFGVSGLLDTDAMVTLRAETQDGTIKEHSSEMHLGVAGSYWISVNAKYSDVKELRLLIYSFHDTKEILYDQYLRLDNPVVSFDFSVPSDKKSARKIFVLGFPKAGTTSLHKAFESSGIPSAHWEVTNDKGELQSVGSLLMDGYMYRNDIWYNLKKFRAVTQADVCLPSRGLNIWPQLQYSFVNALREEYPDCLFILNYIPAEELAENMINWGNLQARLVESDIPGLPVGSGTTKAELVNWINNHYKWVRKNFEGDNNFLELDIKNDDVRRKLSDALGEEIVWWDQSNENIGVSFILNPKVTIAKHIEPSDYEVEFIDNDTGTTVFKKEDAKDGTYVMANRQYYTNWLVRVKNPRTKYVYKEVLFNPNGKRVFIVLDSKSIGDTVAWMPYVEDFRTLHHCDVICSTFHRRFFESVYPDIEFVDAGSTVYNIYAQFNIGAYDNDYNKNYRNWRSIPLQQVASDCLGLPYEELRPRLYVPIVDTMEKFKKPYVTLSEHSTFQMMYWNNPAGWKDVVEFLDSEGYSVVNVSKEGSNIPGVVNPKSYDMDYTLYILKNAKFHMGVSTGGCWLAWALGKSVVMVSGCTPAAMEFQSDCYRVINTDVCNGCFGDPTLPIDRGNWNWCPRGRNFECTRKISSEHVISDIRKLLSRLEAEEAML